MRSSRPWSQAVRAIVELKGIDAYGVYMADRDYYLGSGPTALEIYSMASIDLLLPLPGDQCPMHPRIRAALESRRGEMEALVPTSLKEHRDFMHRMHVPLPIEI
jgi:hypothetical protein